MAPPPQAVQHLQREVGEVDGRIPDVGVVYGDSAFGFSWCGSTESGGSVEPASTVPASTAPAPSVEVAATPVVPQLRGLTFAAAKARLQDLGMTWRWIFIQELEGRTEAAKVCRQEPAAGTVDVTEATLALADTCDIKLPKLTGMALGDATKLLDANRIGWQLEDGVDIDFPASIDRAPPEWHVCGGDAGYAVDDAVAFLSTGDTYTGMAYGDGDWVTVFLQVAPEAALCSTTNDGEDP
jgi:hypothetical protein